MTALFIHKDAEADLEALWQVQPKVAARVLVLLEQLAVDADLLDRLTQHDYAHPELSEFHVSKWQAQWRQGRDLWRLKIWDLEEKGLRYRLIYAFLPQQQHYHLLAVAPREFDYDPSHPISQRILHAYQNL